MKRLMLVGVFIFIALVATAWAQSPGGGSYGMGGLMYGYGGYGPGYGMGPGMMYGYGMGQVYGWGPGHRGYSQGVPTEACQKFLDETAGLRKELHNKRYEYFEAMRNPNAKPEDIAKKEKEIHDLQVKIYAENPQGCWY